MTLAETGHSNAAVSLAAVLAGDGVAARDPGLTVPELAERIVVGGWPGNLGVGPREASDALQGYLEDLYQDDLRRLDGRSRDPEGVRRLIASLARNIATPASISTLTRDANGLDRGYQSQTISGYLQALQRLMITDDAEPVKRDETRGLGQLCAGASFGGLIQAGPGNRGGSGRLLTNRSGWAA